ncbi:hypothetical protein [Desulfomicrobium apsheronum]|uniref:hypothetical protein n=1 Tax=Desulfomicrobium apsheronum TaxID=52560 RepID=UPI000B81874F|nr:hypothetical protein [Desulfomicrobium apsheronum]
MKTNAHAWDIPAQMGIHAFLALAKMDSRLRGNDPDKGAKPWCCSMKTKIPPCFAPTAAQRVVSLRTGSQAGLLATKTWDAMKTNAHAWDIPAQMGIHAFLALAKMDSRLRGNDPDKDAKPWRVA